MTFWEAVFIAIFVTVAVHVFALFGGYWEQAGSLSVIAVIIALLLYREQSKKDSKSNNKFSDPRVSEKPYVINDKFDIPRKLGDPIITKVVGVTFEDRQRIVHNLKIGEMLMLEKEENNPHDSNAVKVVKPNGQQVGYLNRELAKDVQIYFEMTEFKIQAEVIDLTGRSDKEQNQGVVIKIYPPSPEDVVFSTDYRHF